MIRRATATLAVPREAPSTQNQTSVRIDDREKELETQGVVHVLPGYCFENPANCRHCVHDCAGRRWARRYSFPRVEHKSGSFVGRIVRGPDETKNGLAEVQITKSKSETFLTVRGLYFFPWEELVGRKKARGAPK